MLRRIVEKTVDKKRLQPVRVDNLIPGMSLGTDVFAANGTFLLAKGTIINESSINLLESNYVFSVYIDEKPHVHSEREKEMLTRSERIRLSPEFAEFRRNFEATVESIEEQLNDIVFKNVETLDTEELVKKPLDLLTGYSTADIFDMLHNLRRYDDTTYVHSVNVSLISGIIARWCGLDDEDVQTAILAGVLHDIGKMKIPDSIIKKPGKLTKEEFKIVKNHTVEGYRILQRCKNADNNMKYAALMHHERCDGMGYPMGLKASQINTFAKIVAIADVYDAMTSARCYRGPICPFTVIDIMIQEGLAKYDTLFIMNFLQHMGETYLNNNVRLSDGETGEIVFIDGNLPSKPIIKMDDGTILPLRESPLKIEAIL